MSLRAITVAVRFAGEQAHFAEEVAVAQGGQGEPLAAGVWRTTSASPAMMM